MQIQEIHVFGLLIERNFQCVILAAMSATMIKFLPLDLLGVSHRILWKNENAVYRLQIPALVLEIFKFAKCVKYTNEMTDVVHALNPILRHLCK